MNAASPALRRSTTNNLDQVVEPLADYICASDRPETVLRSILAVLRRQVEATNGAAADHFATARRFTPSAVRIAS